MALNLAERSSDFFSFPRLWLLIRLHVINNYRSWISTSIAIAGIILFTSLFSDSGNNHFYRVWFDLLVLLGGLFFTSKAFIELHDKTRNESFLLMPASSFEKTLAKLLLVTVGFCLYMMIFMVISSVGAELIKSLTFGSDLPIFNPFSEQVWQTIGVYFFIHSFYFLGAAWFRKNHVVKTTLSLLAVVLVFLSFTILLVRLFYPSLTHAVLDFGSSSDNFFELFGGGIISSLVKLFILFMPVALWLITWTRVKETQVSSGI